MRVFHVDYFQPVFIGSHYVRPKPAHQMVFVWLFLAKQTTHAPRYGNTEEWEGGGGAGAVITV